MRLLSAFLLLVLAGTSAPWSAQAASRFAHQGIAEDAQRYEKYVRENWKPGGKAAADLKAFLEARAVTPPPPPDRE